MTTYPALTSTASAVGGFFACLGRGIGRAAVGVHGAVDPDARRDLAWMPVLALASVGPGTVPPKPLPDDGHRPLVCVHGLAGMRGNFTPLRTWLRMHGRTRTYSVGLHAATLEEKARELRAFIAEVARVNDLPDGAQVDLVAHSMGGLVSRYALRDPATAARVHTLVTLGTPHRGTHAARFAGGPLTDALRRGSKVVNELHEDAKWGGPIRLVCFWSTSDPLMQPAETATLQGADNRAIDGFSHLDWLMRRRAWMEVEAALRA